MRYLCFALNSLSFLFYFASSSSSFLCVALLCVDGSRATMALFALWLLCIVPELQPTLRYAYNHSPSLFWAVNSQCTSTFNIVIISNDSIIFNVNVNVSSLLSLQAYSFLTWLLYRMSMVEHVFGWMKPSTNYSVPSAIVNITEAIIYGIERIR